MKTLKDFIKYLRENRLREAGLYNLNILKGMDIPLIKLAQKKGLIKSLDDEDTVKTSIENFGKFLSSLEDGTAIEKAKTRLKDWEEDKIPGFSKHEILPSDLVLAYAAQKTAIQHFLPDFTSDSKEAIEILRELEDYYTHIQNNAIQLVFKIQKDTETQLNEIERKFILMVQNVKDYAFFMLDTKGYIKSWNDGARRIKGYTAAEVIGKHISIFYMDEDRKNNVPNHYLEMAEKLGHYETEGKRVRKNGTTFWANITITAIYDENKKLTGFSKLTKDITEMRNAKLALEQKAMELERSNSELEQFAYVASHDLQEPLRTISSYVQLLSSRYKDKLDDEANEFIDFAVEGSKRMKQLITSLLEYSRVNKSQVFEHINLIELLENVKEDMNEQIQESGAIIKYDVPPEIYGDEILLSQLFQNLLVNAIKFRSDKKPEIEIVGKKDTGFCLFSIKDNGIGISPEYFGKIFVIFQRLHKRESYSGSGIGLSICKKIVERHGGKIWVESEPGKGSIFYFTIKEA